MALLRAGYTVIEMWECDWDRLVDNEPAVSQFLASFDLVPPLEPREAFFAGRTGAVALHAVAGEGEEIRYVDVTSLYPWVNKNCPYPIGHPQIITQPVDQSLDSYFVLATVDILPPAGLFHLVLPVLCSQKLTFPVCRSCVQEEQAPSMLTRTHYCPHSDADRMLRGTWCMLELVKAVEKGYTLVKIHEVWHFPPQQRQTGLFKDYVNTWLKLKQGSAGWPSWCQTLEQKRQYILRYQAREGIRLDIISIAKNPGRKATAKLMLNSFWGKFGERINKPTTVTVKDPLPFVQSHLRCCPRHQYSPPLYRRYPGSRLHQRPRECRQRRQNQHLCGGFHHVPCSAQALRVPGHPSTASPLL